MAKSITQAYFIQKYGSKQRVYQSMTVNQFWIDSSDGKGPIMSPCTVENLREEVLKSRRSDLILTRHYFTAWTFKVIPSPIVTLIPQWG